MNSRFQKTRIGPSSSNFSTFFIFIFHFFIQIFFPKFQIQNNNKNILDVLFFFFVFNQTITTLLSIFFQPKNFHQNPIHLRKAKNLVNPLRQHLSMISVKSHLKHFYIFHSRENRDLPHMSQEDRDLTTQATVPSVTIT